MKKAFLFSLGLVVALSSLFVSCSEQEMVYNVSLTATKGGSATFSDYLGTSMVVYGESEVSVVATPDKGYSFIGWYVGFSETPVCTTLAYTTVVKNNLSLVAKFVKDGNEVESDEDELDLICNISLTPSCLLHAMDAGGVAMFENTSTNHLAVYAGKEVTAVAVAAEDYAFVGWYVGESKTPVSTDAVYTFVAQSDLALEAKFSGRQNITVRCNDGGSVSIVGKTEHSVLLLSGEEVTVVATPNEKCDFLGWFIGDSNEPVSTEATYTFTVKENVSLVAKFYKPFDSNGYDYVDLGLPSGIKWAAYNVGATAPEEYGDYFAWGEISPKSSYYESNSVTYGKSMSDISGNAQYDAARANWGGDWRMPTPSEQRELLNNCSWQWTTLNGVNGYKVTGPNGNSIFLPAAGYRSGTSLYSEGSSGGYWSSTPGEDDSNYAYDLYFNSSSFDWSSNYGRNRGQSVRPVLE